MSVIIIHVFVMSLNRLMDKPVVWLFISLLMMKKIYFWYVSFILTYSLIILKLLYLQIKPD